MLQNKKLLFVILCALSLASCNTLKKPPDYSLCSAIWRGNVLESYGYCISASEVGREFRVTSEQIFRERYVMMSAKDYVAVKKYTEYLKAQAEKRCR